MGKILRIAIHEAENTDLSALSGKVGSFHVKVIERRLNGLSLTAEQKVAVVDMIIEKLKTREII